MTLLNHHISKMFEPIFLNFARVSCNMFLTVIENLARLQHAVSELWRGEKCVGEFNATTPSKSRVKCYICLHSNRHIELYDNV